VPQKHESPGSHPGLKLGTRTPSALTILFSYGLLSRHFANCRVTAESEGVEPQWLTRPLDRFADGVQCPLATLSRRKSAHKDCKYRVAIRHLRNEFLFRLVPIWDGGLMVSKTAALPNTRRWDISGCGRSRFRRSRFSVRAGRSLWKCLPARSPAACWCSAKHMLREQARPR